MIEVRIKIHALRDKEEVLQIPYFADKSIYEYAEEVLQLLVTTNKIDLKRLLHQNTVRILVNNRVIHENLLKTKKLQDNDQLKLLIVPAWAALYGVGLTIAEFIGIGGELATLFAAGFSLVATIGIGTVVGLLGNALMKKSKKPTTNKDEMGDSSTYNWDGPDTSYAVGKPLSLIYGNSFVGGDVISSYVEGLGSAYQIGWQSICAYGYKCASGGGIFLWNSSAPPVGVPSPYALILDLSGEETGDEPILSASRIKFFLYIHYTDNWVEYANKKLVIYRTTKIIGATEWEEWEPPWIVDTFGLETYELTLAPNRYTKFFIYSRSNTTTTDHNYVYSKPFLTDIQVEATGPINTVDTEQETLELNEGLRLILALSSGEIYDINPEFYINDVAKRNYYSNLEGGGQVGLLEVQNSLGYKVPILNISNISYIPELLSKKLLSNTVGVEFELKQCEFTIDNIDPDNPGINAFLHTTISDTVEGFTVELVFPNGIFKIDDAGAEQAGVVQLAIAYKTVKEVSDPVIPWKWISDSPNTNILTITQFKYGQMKIFISSPPLTASAYSIKIWRMTPVETNPQKGWNELTVIGVSEFGYQKQVYPSTAFVALNMVATNKLSGSIPNFLFDVKGRFVKCPVLKQVSTEFIIPIQFDGLITKYDEENLQYDWVYYNPLTELYEDVILTENTQYQYTNCPPFIIYDLLTTQDLYPYITEDTFVWQDWIDAAEICWEGILPTQYAADSTTKEHRFELDVVIDTEQDAASIIVQLLSLIRGKLYWIGSKLRLRIMKPENATQLFTDADILPDTYQEVYNQESKLPNTIEVSYYDRAFRGKQQTLQVSRKDTLAWKGRIIKQSVSLIGVARQSQALRMASYLLNYASISNKIITFTAPISALVSIPGDVIQVQHSTMTYGNGGYFREISDVSGGITTFYLDRTIHLTGTDDTPTILYTMIVSRRTTNTAGIPTEYELVSVTDTDYYDSVQVTGTIAPDYAIGDIWYIVQQGITPTQYIKKYRILTINRSSEKDEVVVTCEPYDEDIYADYVSGVDLHLPPITPPMDIINSPVDVINLIASQVWGTYDAKVTYSIPTQNDYNFYSVIEELNSNIFIYRRTDNDTGLVRTRSLFIYDSITGQFKGQVYINELNKTTNEITFAAFDSFLGSVTVGDYVIQKIEGSYLRIDHTIVAISTDGRVYNEIGIDSSKGTGYLIKSLQVNKTYWIKVQSVAVTGTRSLNPPITTIKIGTTECIEYPTHLTLCNKGEDVSDFTGCDICISWNASSRYAGAGMVIEGDADDIGAGESGDYKLRGYNVWIYDNSGSTPQLIKMEPVKDPTYIYTQDINIEDQQHLGISGNASIYGQRYISFQVYQEDLDGNVSCEPAVLEVHNNPPSMAGFTPTHTVRDRMVTINWGEYINNPGLFEVDILGYQVWYGTSDADMVFIDVPGKTSEQTKITGLSTGTYYIYVLPYDCFGAGDARTYRSNILTAIIVGEVISEYIPPIPGGFAGSFVIEEVIDSGTYYTMYLTGASLTLYGFSDITDPEDYISLPYHSDKVYYNTNPAVDGYCYVTASNVNTSNVNDPQLRIWYDETTYPANPRWAIRVSPAPPAILVDRGYLVADGVPQVDQYVSINICGGLTYEEGGVFWGGSLKSDIHVRWFSPNELTCNMDRVSYFEFTISSPTSAIVSQPHIYVDGSVHYADGDYYEQTFHGPGEVSVSVACKLWSDSDNISETISSGVFIATDSLSNTDDPDIINSPWRVVTDDGGRNIQVVLDNWDIIWNNPNIKQLEIYAQLGTWNFITLVFEQPVAISNIDQYPDRIANYQEYEYTEGGHTRLGNIDPIDDSIHFRLGETTGPIFAWKNEQCSSEGGLCIYRTGSPPEYTCAAGCSGYGTGDCPHGNSLSCDQEGICIYRSEDTGCSRAIYDISTGTEIIYNKYYIALGFRLVNGNIVFVRNESSGDIEVKGTEFGLIDSMFIMNAAITTAKIDNLAVNNAKIRNLSGEKVWIGGSGEPFVGACIYDQGSWCDFHEWTEAQTPDTVPPGYYKTGLCPRGLVSGSGLHPACQYTPGLFAVDRIFRLDAGFDDREFTYINGGFIYTNSIVARSIQVGALPYVLDLQVDREFDFSITDALLTSYVTVRWHKSGQDLINGMISFVDDTKIYITEDVYTFTGTEIPSGVGTDIRRIHVGYLDYFDPDIENTPQLVQFTQVDDVVQTPAGIWIDADNTFAHLRTEGRLPLFAVVIINNPGSGEGASFDGRGVGDPQTIANSDFGQFIVRITMANPSPGTYIRNDDITTGIVHNEAWTSVLDLRHYTGYDISIGHVGHGRLLLDAPSQVYSHDLGGHPTFGWNDHLGHEWWNYISTWPNSSGCDVKLLIGRPYVDGLEAQPGFSGTREYVESLCDNGYLWYYRSLDEDSGLWVGNLEIGGKLRVKDITTEPYRDLLVGQKYEQSPELVNWNRVSSPGITLYDITNLVTGVYNSDPDEPGNRPELLLKLGGSIQISSALEELTSTHYFRSGTDDDIAVSIQFRAGQLPKSVLLQSETTEVSLLIVTPYVAVPYYPLGYYSRDVGLLILSPNIDPGVVPFGKIPIHYGLYVDVSAQTGIYINNKVGFAWGGMTTLYGQHICMDSTNTFNLVGDLCVTAISCELKAGTGQTAVGISMDFSALSQDTYFCHMRAGPNLLGPNETIGDRFGTWDVGEVGDVVVGEWTVWFKTSVWDIGGPYQYRKGWQNTGGT